jgi:hypothetical protein
MITPELDRRGGCARRDAAPEERSPLASSGAFATRTMAELLEKQGDPARRRADPRGARRGGRVRRRGDAAVIAVLERWLDNARRLQP